MKQYLDLIKRVMHEGITKGDRTGTGTRSIFGHQMEFNLQEGFPLLTTKKIHFKSVVHELLWFLRGGTNTEYLNDNGVKIWDNWAKDGNLGPVYGKQWRSWDVTTSSGPGTIDQVDELIYMLKNNPDSRRLIVSAWNPADLPDEKFSPQTNVTAGRMALAPCHLLFQFYTVPMSLQERIRYAKDQRGHILDVQGGKRVEDLLDILGVPTRAISLQMYQRSADIFLGVPFNIASYSLLLMMVAQVVNMVPYKFVHTLGDAHIYSDHKQQTMQQVLRTPKTLPRLKIYPEIYDIDKFKYEHFKLEGYNPHEHISGSISV